MSHEDEAIDRLFDTVRDVAPSEGALSRIQASLETSRAERSPPRTRWLALAAAGAGVVAAISAGVMLQETSDAVIADKATGAPKALRVLRADRARNASGVAIGDRVAVGELASVDAPGRLEVALSSATVRLTAGGARFHPDRVDLEPGGSAEITGACELRGGDCRARIDGSEDVRVVYGAQVTIFAAYAQVIEPTVACRVVALREDDDTSSDDSGDGTGDEAAEQPTEPTKTARRARSMRSELTLQLESYDRATALAGVDDARALREWRSLLRRWPRSPLRPEVELHVIDALVRLGRTGDARDAARRYLRRHPNTPRRTDLLAIAEEPATAEP